MEVYKTEKNIGNPANLQLLLAESLIKIDKIFSVLKTLGAKIEKQKEDI